MGTNYYARITPSKKRKDELCNLIQNSMDFRRINELVKETYGRPDYPDYETGTVKAGEIHLGKSSYGWKFLWDPNLYEIRQGHMEYDDVNDPEHHHGKYVDDPSKAFAFYELTQNGLKEFIDREDVEVYDEYGDIQDKEEFWNFVINKTGIDAKQYEEEVSKGGLSRNAYIRETDYTKFLSSIGYDIKWPYHDFYSDGLRFATNTDFS